MSRVRYAVVSGLLAGLLGMTLIACSVVDSKLIDVSLPYAGAGPACNSTLGSYSLARAYVRVVIEQTLPAPPILKMATDKDGFTKRDTLEVIRRPDPTLTACLDHLSSMFSHDVIDVMKDVDAAALDPTGSQFLRAVQVNAADRSAKILRTLIRTAFIAISGDPNFSLDERSTPTATAPLVLADVNYDPFDVRDTAKTNARLAELGYCLVLDGFSYNDRFLTVDQYCSTPYRALEPRALPIAAELYEAMAREPVPPIMDGLIYRPRQPYLISVYRKIDPGGRKRWAMERRLSVDLENLSPVLAIKLPRAPFATRNALLLFDKGTLVTACVTKSSELENFVTVPYEVVRSIVVLPGRVFQVKIDRATKSKELVLAETQLLKLQRAQIKALQTGKFDANGAAVATPAALPASQKVTLTEIEEWPTQLKDKPEDGPLDVSPFTDKAFDSLCNRPSP